MEASILAAWEESKDPVKCSKPYSKVQGMSVD